MAFTQSIHHLHFAAWVTLQAECAIAMSRHYLKSISTTQLFNRHFELSVGQCVRMIIAIDWHICGLTADILVCSLCWAMCKKMRRLNNKFIINYGENSAFILLRTCRLWFGVYVQSIPFPRRENWLKLTPFSICFSINLIIDGCGFAEGSFIVRRTLISYNDTENVDNVDI